MKVILLDDEQLALDYLEHQLNKTKKLEIVGKFGDPHTCYDFVLHHHVDVAFLDIHMPEMNGIELAERLLEHKPHLHVVFCTAYDEYAIKAFELNALDYLMKPVREERLSKTLRRIQSSLDTEHTDTDLPTVAPIQLRLFQQLLIEKEDNQFPPIHWRTQKAQELFLYLLQHREQLVRKSVLIETFWPDFEINRAYSQLYTNVYYIRKTLKPYKDHLVISNEMEGYILYVDNVQLDVEEWEQSLQAHLPITPKTIVPLENAMKLYTGDYLQDFGYWWAERERYRLQMLWVQTSMQMAKWYMSNGHEEMAIRKYQEICDRYPLTEDAHFSLMNLYAGWNKPYSVRNQFHYLETILKDELNEKPSPYIREWYEQWEDNLSKIDL